MAPNAPSEQPSAIVGHKLTAIDFSQQLPIAKSLWCTLVSNAGSGLQAGRENKRSAEQQTL
jgi:hypothetical protein